MTDEFISYLKAAGEEFDLGQATEFLVVAATLLDLKAARLLPAAEVEDEEDLALLEARDLLFARLLQYRAYKLAAAHLGTLAARAGRRFGRVAELEPRFAALSPELRIGVDPHQFAAIAAAALRPRPVPVVGVDHLHAPRVSVREHMAALAERLARTGSATFRSLVADCGSTLEVVARFLGLLELYRDGAVSFEQAEALSELRVRWIGGARDPAGPDQSDRPRSAFAGGRRPATRHRPGRGVRLMTQPQEAAAEDALAEAVSIDEALAEEAVAEAVVPRSRVELSV